MSQDPVSEEDKIILTDTEKDTIKQMVVEYCECMRRLLELRSSLDNRRMLEFGEQNPGFGFSVILFAGLGPKLVDMVELFKTSPAEGEPDFSGGVALNGSISLFAVETEKMPVVTRSEYPLPLLLRDLITIIRSVRIRTIDAVPFLIQLIHVVSSELLDAQHAVSRAASDMLASVIFKNVKPEGEA